ncbi:MAG TPA: T9SS type A sorting domain-containing protein [Ignavibacteriaceae bacterium]|nr:T9SS type A sorting domain-containing protein [Ignavibacteriaceae bacterium]
MKRMILVLLVSLLVSVCSFAQVTNLLVNGSSSNFTGVSGSQFGWSYDVPSAGDTTFLQIWIDTDNNGVLNNSVDVLWNSFMQIDGDPNGHNGPPDIDGTADGHVSFMQNLGLAPVHYIIYFKNNNIIKLIAGQLTALASPTFTISGRITNNGAGMQYLVVNLQAENGNNFWTGITDANGNYTIYMNSDTTGNPWGLKIDNTFKFNPKISNPESFSFTIDPSVATSYQNYNFTVENAAAHISGTLYSDALQPIIGRDVYITANNGVLNRYVLADSVGHFDIGLLGSEVPVTNLTLGSGDSRDTAIVAAHKSYSSVLSGNALTQDLFIFNANTTITGRVTLNGSAPGFTMSMWAENQDTCQTETMTNDNGDFRFNVSSKVYNYDIEFSVPSGYSYNKVTAHPGQSNVNINLTLTDVQVTKPGIPSGYLLSQNYPNPFNPATIIDYEIPKSAFVTLSIYNVLGQEIARLVNEELSAGFYSVNFNAANLASGIYFYRIQAADFVSFKKMMLMK